MRIVAQRAADAVAAARAVQPYDLSNVVFRARSTTDAEFRISYASYIAEGSKFGSEALSQVGQAGPAHTGRPTWCVVSQPEGAPQDLVFSPTAHEGPSTVPVRWVEGGLHAHIDLRKLLMVRSFPIPEGSRAHIPISQEEFEGLGPSIVLHLSQATFTPISKRNAAASTPAAGSTK